MPARALRPGIVPLAVLALAASVAACSSPGGGGSTPSAAPATPPAASPAASATAAACPPDPVAYAAGKKPVVPAKPSLPAPASKAPAEPGGDGTTATISTCLGDITLELFTRSAPVASTNFAALAEAGYYDGVVFHRLVPGFVIQGGDGEFGDIEAYDQRRVGSGGPGYTIPDEPFAGRYARGIVAMARTSEPNSQGSQFFIVLDDEAEAPLESYRTYVIFGRVTQGMEVVDRIAAMPNSGEPANQAVQPLPMQRVTVTRP